MNTHMLQKVSQGSIFPRADGKIIDEHFGALHTQQDNFSLAHMTAPPGWREPAQIAEFDEVVIVLQGVLVVEADNQRIEVRPDFTYLIDPGAKVTYNNASQNSPCIYRERPRKPCFFQAGDEWAFLVWGRGGGRTALVFALLLNISFNGFAADVACCREEIGRRPQHRQSSQMGKFLAQEA